MVEWGQIDGFFYETQRHRMVCTLDVGNVLIVITFLDFHFLRIGNCGLNLLLEGTRREKGQLAP